MLLNTISANAVKFVQRATMATTNYFGNKFTFFYTASSPFSQFHPAVFERDGVKYKCAEQYMMHQKAVLFKDDEIAAQILSAEKPGQMKALGRKVRNFDDHMWKKHRERIVHEGSTAKFSQNPDLKRAILKTRGTYLVEASPRDRVYGIGLGASNPKAKDPKNWRGQNLLGKILTDVREQLIVEEGEGTDEQVCIQEGDIGGAHSQVKKEEGNGEEGKEKKEGEGRTKETEMEGGKILTDVREQLIADEGEGTDEQACIQEGDIGDAHSQVKKEEGNEEEGKEKKERERRTKEERDRNEEGKKRKRGRKEKERKRERKEI